MCCADRVVGVLELEGEEMIFEVHEVVKAFLVGHNTAPLKGYLPAIVSLVCLV